MVIQRSIRGKAEEGQQLADQDGLTKEETDLLSSLSKELLSPPPPPSSVSVVNANHPQKNISKEEDQHALHPALVFGLMGALIAHGAIIFSLPPVLTGRGAPFLPTASNGMNVMFQQLKQQPYIRNRIKMHKTIENNSSIGESVTYSSGNENGNQTTSTRNGDRNHARGLNFVDLGSGDGRVVFRAAREGIFSKSVGYEINPVLHAWASMRRIIQAPKYLHSTKFYIKDLWKVNLSHADVVAVYGLHPIMDKLGLKMQQELKPGAIVVSNVFTIPGWRPIFSSSSPKHRVHLYSIPESIPKTNDKDFSLNRTKNVTNV